MNTTEHDKMFRLSQVPQEPEVSRHNSQLLHELKAQQVELETQNQDLRQIASTLRDISKRYADHYDLMPIGYLSISARGIIYELNQRAAADLQLPRSKVIATPFTDYIYEEDIPHFLQHLSHALLQSEPATCEVRISSGRSETYYAELVSVGCYREGESSPYIRTCMQNIGRHKEVEAELRQAKDEAVAMNAVKSNFLAYMSHEMRTPLGVVIGYTDLLMNTPAQLNLNEGLRTIQRNSVHLLNLIDDLLDLAKVEAGKLTLESIPFKLVEELENIVGQFQPKAECKGLDLKLTIQNALPTEIYTDPTRFRQIVLNVLSNALKFTDCGSIEVLVACEQGPKDQHSLAERGTGTPLLSIDVVDTGCGIRPDRRGFLFEPFAQADLSTTRRFGGSGLGLCLSRQLARGLGGDLILVESEEFKGSRFRITVNPQFGNHVLAEPLSRPNAKAQTPVIEPLPSLDGYKLLVVEDGIDNQILIKKLLENVGAEVDCAEDGEEAIGCVLRKVYDVILMDIQLPIMDGYEATTHLRAHGCLTPIIALTAHALKEDRRKAEEIGFDAFISKPINWPKLVKSIVQCRDGYLH